MANAMFDLGRKKFADADIDYLVDDIKCAMVRAATWTPDTATDEFLTDVTAGGAVVATSGNFASKTSTAGVLYAADITFSAVAAGAQIDYLVIYKDSGVAATSPLFALIDTATGWPYTPNGTDIIWTWDSGANKILKL